jgi:outer membrane protein OmpA-like peptidoglycan-associated protein
MKIFFRVLLLSTTLLVINPAFSQSEKKLIKEAEDAERAGDANTALNLFQEALKKNPENPQANLKVGILYLDMLYKHKSLPYLEKAFSLNPKISPDIHKYLGQSYQYNHEWDKAIEQYELCRKTLHKEDGFLRELDRRIYECNNGKEFMANPVDAKIINMGSTINTKFPEFAPVISADESVLIFTSRREGSTGGGIDEFGEYYEDIYWTEKQSNGDWGPVKNIGKSINTDGHDASIGLSADGKELFTYDGKGGKGDFKYCKLKKDSTWSKPYPLEGVNSKYGETSICISPDGSTIFFTSDRPGGQGQLDIYRSTLLKNGQWSKPENLGSTINTEENEDAVFLDFDGKTLYFSSQAHKGMGEYDIFKSVYDSSSNKWSQPENLGFPINTADNDIYFVLSGDGKHGYYASIREDGYGEKDLYMIQMPPRHDYEHLVAKMEKMLKKEIVKEEVKPVEKVEEKPIEVKKGSIVLQGVVMDVNSKEPLAARVQLLDLKGKVLKEVNCGEDGFYSFEVSFESQKKISVTAQMPSYGMATSTVAIPTLGTDNVEIKRDLSLVKLEVGTKFVLRNIYYDYDKAVLRPESVNELGKILKILNENPTMVVRIGSHTDNWGTNDYNIDLSQRRAQAVVSWLVRHGINHSRLQSKGYGEEEPIASNDDEAEGRELNRRTEFEVIRK